MSGFQSKGSGVGVGAFGHSRLGAIRAYEPRQPAQRDWRSWMGGIGGRRTSKVTSKSVSEAGTPGPRPTTCPTSTRLDVGPRDARVQLLQLGDKVSYRSYALYVATVPLYAARHNYRLLQLHADTFAKFYKPLCIGQHMSMSTSELLLYVDLDVFFERFVPVELMPMAADESCALSAQATSKTVNSGLLLIRPHDRVAVDLVARWTASMHPNGGYDQTYFQAVLVEHRQRWLQEAASVQPRASFSSPSRRSEAEVSSPCLPKSQSPICVAHPSSRSCDETRPPVRGKPMWSELNACFAKRMNQMHWNESKRSWGGLCFWNASQRVNVHDMGVDPWKPCDWMHHVNKRHWRIFSRAFPLAANRSLSDFLRFRAFWRSVPFNVVNQLDKARAPRHRILAKMNAANAGLGASYESDVCNGRPPFQGSTSSAPPPVRQAPAYPRRQAPAYSRRQAPAYPRRQALGLMAHAPPKRQARTLLAQAQHNRRVKNNLCKPSLDLGCQRRVAPLAARTVIATPGSCSVRWAAAHGPLVVTLTSLPSRIHLLAAQVEALWQQTLPPSEVVLNLARTPTLSPQVLHATAPALAELQARGQLTVRWVQRDLGPLTKLMPTLLNAHEHARRFVLRANASMRTESTGPSAAAVARALEEMAIVTIDDHDIYSGNMLCRLVTGALEHPNAAVGFRGFNLHSAMRTEAASVSNSRPNAGPDGVSSMQMPGPGGLCDGKRWHGPYHLPIGSCCYRRSANNNNHVKAANARTANVDAHPVHVLNQVGALLLRLPLAQRVLPLLLPNATARRCSAYAALLIRQNDDLLVSAALAAVGLPRLRLSWPTDDGDAPYFTIRGTRREKLSLSNTVNRDRTRSGAAAQALLGCGDETTRKPHEAAAGCDAVDGFPWLPADWRMP